MYVPHPTPTEAALQRAARERRARLWPPGNAEVAVAPEPPPPELPPEPPPVLRSLVHIPIDVAPDEDGTIAVQRRPTVAEILCQVAQQHGLPPDVVVSGIRTRPVVYARHELFYRVVNETLHTVYWIGRRLGFDHTSVLNGVACHCIRNNLPAPRGLRSIARVKRQLAARKETA